MPLQNRVAPDGTIWAVADRGTMYGNRGGCFHRDDGRLKDRRWATPQWLVCVLAFKGRRRRLLQPGRFTELFFLDEATAFAAGHRPCFECRRAEAERFRTLWCVVTGAERPAAGAMDRQLQAERVDAAGGKRTVSCDIDRAADGVMVVDDGTPALVLGDKLFPWTFGGYGAPRRRPAQGLFTMLTPPTIAAILAAGYRPIVHATAARPPMPPRGSRRR